jgi:hypothetical protein
MNKKNIIILIISIFFVLAVGISAYIYFHSQQSPKTSKIDQNDFTLTYTYQGNNLWEYTVEGKLPTPCYSATTDALVMESYPEQVKIKVTTSENPSIEVCSAVIKDYSYSGTFNASNKATVSLVVE